MDPFERYKGSDVLSNQILQNLSRTQATSALNQVGNEEKTTLVHEENRRMNWLLKKIVQLLSIQVHGIFTYFEG